MVPIGNNSHYHLTLDINGAPIDFIVDTGATQVVLTKEDAERAGYDLSELRFVGSATTANGTVPTAPIIIDTIELGGIMDVNLRAVVNGGEMDGSLLGMSYLNGFERIEIRDSQLVLTR